MSKRAAGEVLRDGEAALTLFDTHAHLDFDRFEEDFDAMLGRSRAAGVERIVTIGASAGFASNHRALKIAESQPGIWASVGIHPHDAKVLTDEMLTQIEAWAKTHSRVVAVGETGLDYHYELSSRAEQQEAFRSFVRLAKRVDKPLIIHTREAEADTLAILKEEGAAACGGVLHCFSGTEWLAMEGLALGFYVSFSGIVTFKSAKEIQRVAKAIPAERILIETDAPYLAPTPKRGKRNEPAFVAHTLRYLAELRGESPAQLAAQTTQNALRFYGLREDAV